MEKLYRKILATAEVNRSVDSRERKSMLETGKTNLFHCFSTEKSRWAKICICNTLRFGARHHQKNQARLDTIHHAGFSNCSQGFELLHTKFNHVEQLVVKHSSWKFRWLLVWAINEFKQNFKKWHTQHNIVRASFGCLSRMQIKNDHIYEWVLLLV